MPCSCVSNDLSILSSKFRDTPHCSFQAFRTPRACPAGAARGQVRHWWLVGCRRPPQSEADRTPVQHADARHRFPAIPPVLRHPAILMAGTLRQSRSSPTATPTVTEQQRPFYPSLAYLPSAARLPGTICALPWPSKEKKRNAENLNPP